MYCTTLLPGAPGGAGRDHRRKTGAAQPRARRVGSRDSLADVRIDVITIFPELLEGAEIPT